MKRKWIIILGLASLPMGLSAEPASAAALSHDEIPLVGIDSNGNAVETWVTSSELAQNLSSVLNSLGLSALKALSARPAIPGRDSHSSFSENPQPTQAPGWMLRSVVVGVGVSAEAGLGPIKAGALPRIRLGFSNSTEPSMP